MKRIDPRKTIIASSLAATLLLAGVAPAFAFKGMGSTMPDSSAGHGRQLMEDNVIATHAGNSDTVVARVNGSEITMGSLMETVKEVVMQGYGSQQLTSELARRIRYEALEKLALEELAYQRALDMGITVDQEAVATQMEALTAAEGGEAGLARTLEQRNQSREELETDIIRLLAVKEAIHQAVDNRIEVGEEEINAAYEANRQYFVTPERVVITDIVFFLDPGDPASRERVAEVRRQVVDTHHAKPKGLPADGFVVQPNITVSPANLPDLYEAAKKMEVGAVSDPLLVDGTLHLITFDSYQPRREKGEVEAKAVVARKLKSMKRRELLARWRQDLLKEAKITIVHEILEENHS